MIESTGTDLSVHFVTTCCVLEMYQPTEKQQGTSRWVGSLSLSLLLR